jgi:hypothetical protein
VKFHVLLTTYEMVSKHLADIRRLEWSALVVDEAHRLKNASSRLFQVRGAVAGCVVGGALDGAWDDRVGLWVWLGTACWVCPPLHWFNTVLKHCSRLSSSSCYLIKPYQLSHCTNSTLF